MVSSFSAKDSLAVGPKEHVMHTFNPTFNVSIVYGCDCTICMALQTDTSFRRLARLNRPEWPLAVVGSIGSAAAGGMSPAFSFLFASMIAIFYTTDMNKLKRDASFYAGMLGVVGVGGCAAILAQQASFGIMGARLARRVREQLFAAMLKQEVGGVRQQLVQYILIISSSYFRY